MDTNPGLSSCTNHTPEVVENYTQEMKNIYSSTTNSDPKQSKKQNVSVIQKIFSSTTNSKK